MGYWRPLSRALSVLMLMGLLSASAQAAIRDPLRVELPELEVPPGATWYWAGRQMALNNMPMSVKQFRLQGTAEQVKQYYLALWKVKGHGKLVQKAIGDMDILAYELDGVRYSVQFSQSGGSVEGKVVVTPTPLNYRESRKTSLPLPPRAKVVSKVESLDAGKRSESVTFDTSLGVRQVIDYYLNVLENDGWSRFSASGDGETGAVLGFQRQGELLQLNIKALQGRNSSFTQGLINWVK